MSAASPEPQRLRGLDVLKGVAIVLVVAIHATPSGAPEYRDAVVNGFGRLAVPLFLLVSGFLFAARQPTSAKLRSYFWKFTRLHILYSLCYWAVRPLRGAAWQPITPQELLLVFGAFSFPGQFYLFALPQIYFALGFLVPQRFLLSTGLLIGSGLLAAATVAWLAASFDTAALPPLARFVATLTEASPLLWLYPFCLGSWVGGRFAGGRRLPSRAGLSLLLVALAVGAAALDLPPTAGAVYVARYAYARWSIAIGTTLLAFALPWAARTLRMTPFEAFGRESFGIFVLNPLIIDLITRWLGRPSSVTGSLLLAAMTLAIAFPLARALRKRIPFAFP